LGYVAGVLLVLALGVDFSVVPVTVMITILGTRRAKVNSTFLVLGWAFAMALIGGLGLFAFASVDFSLGSPNRTAVEWVHLGIGVLLILFGVLLLVKKSGEGTGPVKRWMDRVDDLKPRTAFVLGSALIILSPKRLALNLAAVAQILHADIGAPALGAVCLLLFIAAASITVTVPPVLYWVVPARAANLLESLNAWLQKHNQSITIGTLMALGGFLAVKGAISIV